MDCSLTLPKAATINDSTQAEMREIENTGTLAAGEKALTELKKRKLVVQKYGISMSKLPGAQYLTNSLGRDNTSL
jgi:phenylalanyl-tRNA synthetase alpha chain